MKCFLPSKNEFWRYLWKSCWVTLNALLNQPLGQASLWFITGLSCQACIHLSCLGSRKTDRNGGRNGKWRGVDVLKVITCQKKKEKAGCHWQWTLQLNVIHTNVCGETVDSTVTLSHMWGTLAHTLTSSPSWHISLLSFKTHSQLCCMSQWWNSKEGQPLENTSQR